MHYGVFFGLAVSLASLCSAEISPYINETLALHNEYRSKHHASELVTDENLNQLAYKCAEHYATIGAIDHSCPLKGKLGENLAWSMSSYGSPSETAAALQATTGWYGEIKDYNFEHPDNSTGVTGHFTQLVWKSSILLGIGSYRDLESKRTYTCALYNPAGNQRWFLGDGYDLYRLNVLQARNEDESKEATEDSTLHPDVEGNDA